MSIMENVIRDWESRGKPIPAPVLYKVKTIVEYAQRYGTKVFVETGTHRGFTIGSVHRFFNDNYSIELADHLYSYCRDLFKDYDRIHLYHGLSEEELPKILERVTEPVTFWLDSHYSAGETAKGPTSSSLYKELPAILDHPVRGHVILIDDTCCLSDSDGYLSVETIEKMILQKYPGYKISVDGYILRAVPE